MNPSLPTPLQAQPSGPSVLKMRWTLANAKEIPVCLATQCFPPPMSHPIAYATETATCTSGGSVCCREASLKVLHELQFPVRANLSNQAGFLMTTRSVLETSVESSMNFQPVFQWDPGEKRLCWLGVVCLAWLPAVAVASADGKYLVFSRDLVVDSPTARPPARFQGARDARFLGVAFGPVQGAGCDEEKRDAAWPMRNPLDSGPALAFLDTRADKTTRETLERKRGASTERLSHPLALCAMACDRIGLFGSMLRALSVTRLASASLEAKADAYADLAARMKRVATSADGMTRAPSDGQESALACFLLVRGWKRFDETDERVHADNLQLWQTLEHLLQRIARHLAGPDAWFRAWNATVHPSFVTKSVGRETQSSGDPTRVEVALSDDEAERLAVGRYATRLDEDENKTAHAWLFTLDAWWAFVEDGVPRTALGAITRATRVDGTQPGVEEFQDPLFFLWERDRPAQVQAAMKKWERCIQACRTAEETLLH